MPDDDIPKPPPRRRAPRKAAPSNVVQIRPTLDQAREVAGEKPVPPRKTTRKPGTHARGGRRTNLTAIKVAERRATVLQLRKLNTSLEVIAQVVREKYKMPRYTRADAHHDIRIALDGIVEEPARELLAEELSRLAVMDSALMPKCATGDIPSILAMLKVMERRSRYRGLDSPIKHNLSGDDVAGVVVSDLTDPEQLTEAARQSIQQILDASSRRTGTSGE